MSVAPVLSRLRAACAERPREPFAHIPAQIDTSRPAAVLVPIVDYGDNATILLTKRTAHLSSHAGQICFPGGMRDAEDGTLLDTALRELEEELAIPATQVEVLGEGRGRITGTGFGITPFIGYLRAPLRYQPDPHEVDTVFELPLDIALRAASYQQLRVEYQGVKYPHDVLHYEGHCIWGATAGILRDICRMVNDEPWEDNRCSKS